MTCCNRHDAGERRQAAGQEHERCDQHVPERAAVGERTGGEVPRERRDRRDRQRAVIDLGREPALRENRLVEKADADAIRPYIELASATTQKAGERSASPSVRIGLRDACLRG